MDNGFAAVSKIAVENKIAVGSYLAVVSEKKRTGIKVAVSAVVIAEIYLNQTEEIKTRAADTGSEKEKLK